MLSQSVGPKSTPILVSSRLCEACFLPRDRPRMDRTRPVWMRWSDRPDRQSLLWQLDRQVNTWRQRNRTTTSWTAAQSAVGQLSRRPDARSSDATPDADKQCMRRIDRCSGRGDQRRIQHRDPLAGCQRHGSMPALRPTHRRVGRRRVQAAHLRAVGGLSRRQRRCRHTIAERV